MLVTEPPDHTRYRKLVTRVFSVRAVEKLRGRTQQIADGLLDDVAARNEVELVSTILAGANRDPNVFERPNDFDVTRANAKDHVSFSSGRHYCLGASLARMEGQVGLQSLFDRYPELVLRAGRKRRGTRILRGYEALPAVLTS